MASREELEEEWRDYLHWQKNQTLEFKDYLDDRDKKIAVENMETLRQFIESMDDDEKISVSDLKELLRYV